MDMKWSSWTPLKLQTIKNCSCLDNTSFTGHCWVTAREGESMWVVAKDYGESLLEHWCSSIWVIARESESMWVIAVSMHFAVRNETLIKKLLKSCLITKNNNYRWHIFQANVFRWPAPRNTCIIHQEKCIENNSIEN